MDDAPALPPPAQGKPVEDAPQRTLFEPAQAATPPVAPEAVPHPAPVAPEIVPAKPAGLTMFPLGAALPYKSVAPEWSAGTDAHVIGGIGSWQQKLPPRGNELPTAQALPDIWNRQKAAPPPPAPSAPPAVESPAAVESNVVPEPVAEPEAIETVQTAQAFVDEPVEQQAPIAEAPAEWIVEDAYAEDPYEETPPASHAVAEVMPIGFLAALPPIVAAEPAAAEPVRARWTLPAYVETLMFWRASTAASLLLAAGLGLAYFGHHDIPLPRAVAAIGVANAPAPLFLAEADVAGHIRITPLAVIAVPNGRDLHLWMIPPGAQSPISLGLLGTTGALASLGGPPVEGTRLIVTLEPHGGLGSGQITGQVLYGGTLATR